MFAILKTRAYCSVSFNGNTKENGKMTTFNIFAQHNSQPIFTGTKGQCRKFLRAKISGRIKTCATHSWDDDRNLFCWDSQTDREFNLVKSI
jgi:hypothetical protein